MRFVGVDLHKKTISLCVMMVVDGKRNVVARKRFSCRDTADIRAFFEKQCPFRVVVEATASYEWFLLLVDDLADRCVLAHPKKLRVIAASKHKSDRIDARILAEFLALDMIPEAYRPSPRVRQHRTLTRHRRWVQGRITSLKCKLRNKAAHYNADVAELFTAQGQQHLADIAMSVADQFEVQNLQEQWELCQRQLGKVDDQLAAFAKTAPAAEQESRAVLATMPQVGAVTIDAVLSELGDWRRFRNSKRVVNKYQRWSNVFDKLQKNTGSPKRAIVGVARRVLCTMFAMLRDGKAYEMAARAGQRQLGPHRRRRRGMPSLSLGRRSPTRFARTGRASDGRLRRRHPLAEP